MSTEYKTTKVYFEVTNTCNFRCDFCPMHVSKRKMRHMDFTLFEKGIQDIVTGHVADTVGFHVLGEPLLYPRIFDAIAKRDSEKAIRLVKRHITTTIDRMIKMEKTYLRLVGKQPE